VRGRGLSVLTLGLACKSMSLGFGMCDLPRYGTKKLAKSYKTSLHKTKKKLAKSYKTSLHKTKKKLAKSYKTSLHKTKKKLAKSNKTSLHGTKKTCKVL
jgi:hypothetical protein